MQRYTVYFIWKLFYMFRVVPPPIIRSANNSIYSIWYLSRAVFNLEPRAWKLGVEVMDLRSVNLFTPFLSPILPYLKPQTFLLEDTLFSTSDQMT